MYQVVFRGVRFNEIDNIWWNWKFAIIIDNVCHFRAQNIGQHHDNYQNLTKGFSGDGFEGQNNCQ